MVGRNARRKAALAERAAKTKAKAIADPLARCNIVESGKSRKYVPLKPDEIPREWFGYRDPPAFVIVEIVGNVTPQLVDRMTIWFKANHGDRLGMAPSDADMEAAKFLNFTDFVQRVAINIVGIVYTIPGDSADLTQTRKYACELGGRIRDANGAGVMLFEFGRPRVTPSFSTASRDIVNKELKQFLNRKHHDDKMDTQALKDRLLQMRREAASSHDEPVEDEDETPASAPASNASDLPEAPPLDDSERVHSMQNVALPSGVDEGSVNVGETGREDLNEMDTVGEQRERLQDNFRMAVHLRSVRQQSINTLKKNIVECDKVIGSISAMLRQLHGRTDDEPADLFLGDEDEISSSSDDEEAQLALKSKWEAEDQFQSAIEAIPRSDQHGTFRRKKRNFPVTTDVKLEEIETHMMGSLDSNGHRAGRAAIRQDLLDGCGSDDEARLALMAKWKEEDEYEEDHKEARLEMERKAVEAQREVDLRNTCPDCGVNVERDPQVPSDLHDFTCELYTS